MQIHLETHVEQGYLDVKAGFNETLFTKLSPPFPPVKLLRFDGSEKGDLVTLELNFIFFKQKWTSEIIEDNTTDLEFYFIDEGVELPFFLKKWKHKHRIISSGIGSIIRDEIEYEAPFGILTYLLYPALWLQFAFRKPIYKRIFRRSEVG
ncbi:SRPBCC family protein [Algoriphagus sp.]|uniref:SRPBCC family protein n=1 Tax=Algoriphagus sp. TaxID=1872435 RepID=UPI00391B8A0F